MLEFEINSNSGSYDAMDALTPKNRSLLMGKIGGKNTKPELFVRKILHGLGYRFRLHRKDLPGSPDIVLPKYQAVIFVHGCFWHGHNCRKGRKPTFNTDFWNEKLARNVEHDKSNIKKLAKLSGVPERLLDHYELWKNEIRLDELLKIACTLEVEVWGLI